MRLLRCLFAVAVIQIPAVSPAAETESPASTAKPVVAVYDFEGLLTEAGQLEASLFNFSMDARRPLTLLDLTLSLEKAASDERVKAVVVDADRLGLDFAQVQELRRRLLEVREAGKDVWVYSEYLANGTALLGSAANHFTLMPEAQCSFQGIHTQSLYFKGLLDKVGVQADVIHIGDFKSFGEMFYLTGPSDYAKQQEEKLIDSVFGQIVKDVAEGRQLAPEKVLSLIDEGVLTAQDAVEHGLADRLMHRTDFVRTLRETYGEEATFDRSYALPKADGPQINGLMDLMKLMFQDAKAKRSRAKNYVAVVALEGDITDDSIAPVRSEILRLVKDDKAKALVLRVNSPGGSALASEVLWEATDEWKQTGKPFVVSMGGVAASGGYYVSSAADRIFAEAGTITGSIGVVGMKFVIGEALEKIGINMHSTQRGKHAGVMSLTRGYSPEEAELVRKSMLAVYETFKKRVTDGRGEALKGDLESLAGGRVYSGKDALAVGLVDEIGGLEEAIAYVASAAELEQPEVKLVPEPKSGLEELFSRPDAKPDDEIIRAASSVSVSERMKKVLAPAGVMESLPEPARSAMVRLAKRIEAFQKTQILLLGPDLEIR